MLVCYSNFMVKSFVFLILFCLLAMPLYAQDIFEDSAGYGYETKQQQEDEIFFYESRFIDIGLHAGARAFTGGLGTLIGVGPSFGGFFTYFFTKRFAFEISIDDSFHQFLIDGKRGTVSLLDFLLRGKYYFVSESYSRALTFANPYMFLGGGEFIRTQARDDIAVKNQSNAFGAEGGLGFEIPIKQRQVFLGIQGSYQWINFPDENRKTERGTPLNGDCINIVATLTYSF
ncbi:MAG: hypothetical protein A3D19_01160 [Deltaproteobacteria bacterium RIFCSPHIGHO2_02_FULL_38_15]|nr:MAG: hypothetical protein A3D19_01160 [Deltaproteobacteria bacterium RIFCSPHIGHO2_02_FULL_38_15]OGQ63603.1 MAG: hypothetical protein A3G92_06540 [Deltaproteobacteria bacterium RIFCSPLOWO2_12_FULL_38_8]HBQ21891.1 hypothetical protein [Deltaproteobacteria bacterium]